jgi:hypothetical protein
VKFVAKSEENKPFTPTMSTTFTINPTVPSNKRFADNIGTWFLSFMATTGVFENDDCIEYNYTCGKFVQDAAPFSKGDTARITFDGKYLAITSIDKKFLDEDGNINYNEIDEDDPFSDPKATHRVFAMRPIVFDEIDNNNDLEYVDSVVMAYCHGRFTKENKINCLKNDLSGDAISLAFERLTANGTFVTVGKNKRGETVYERKAPVVDDDTATVDE